MNGEYNLKDPMEEIQGMPRSQKLGVIDELQRLTAAATKRDDLEGAINQLYNIGFVASTLGQDDELKAELLESSDKMILDLRKRQYQRKLTNQALAWRRGWERIKKRLAGFFRRRAVNNSMEMASDSRQITPNLDYVVIGEQTWSQINTTAVIEGSWKFSEIPSDPKYPQRLYAYREDRYISCYGRLYSLDAALGACPEGWHLPSVEEWKELMTVLGGRSVDALNSLRPNGSSGFNAFPAGKYYDGEFSEGGAECAFWSSTRDISSETFFYCFVLNYIFQDEIPKIQSRGKDMGLSVRYIRD